MSPMTIAQIIIGENETQTIKIYITRKILDQGLYI